MNLTLVKSESFNGVTCDFYQGKNDIWMTREQIGEALEYEYPRHAIEKIHHRHRDRLDRFSTVVNLTTVEGGRLVEREVIMYSAKGVYEICRWSRQPKADAFMDFVWEVVESLRTGRLFDADQVLKLLQGFNDRLAAIEARLDAVLPALPARPNLRLVLPPDKPKRQAVYIHSKIGDLPAEWRAKVDEMLESRRTYRQIADFLRRAGIDVSKSSVGRYAQKYFAQKCDNLTRFRSY